MSVSEFRAGDRVVCVDASGNTGLKTGATYTVTFCDGGVVDLAETPDRWWSHLRFVPAAQEVTPKETPVKDNINQPHHYARFPIEPITFINANALPYNIGNVIKYACRYDAKNGVEDLRKAMRYLEIHIETLERQERVKSGENPQDVWKVAL
jgi:hypothetical protein